MKTTTLAIAAAIAAGLALPSLGETTWTVCADETCDFSSIQSAIDFAVDGDTILVGPGLYAENITFGSKRVSIESVQGSNSTTIDGPQVGTTVRIHGSMHTSSTRLIGFTVSGGAASGSSCSYYGSAMSIVGGSPSIESCRFVARSDGPADLAMDVVSIRSGAAPVITSSHFIGAPPHRRTLLSSMCSSSPTIRDCLFIDVYKDPQWFPPLFQHLGGHMMIETCEFRAAAGSVGPLLYIYWGTQVSIVDSYWSFSGAPESLFAELNSQGGGVTLNVNGSAFNCILFDDLLTGNSSGSFNFASSNTFSYDCCDSPDPCNDCDSNGISDADEIAAGAADCDGNGVPDDCQVDSDGDGAVDECDECPADPSKTAAGFCGCGVSETDSDSDGTPDCNDGCPVDPNKVAPGVCGCGVADTDSDSDGTPDCNDGCPVDPNKVAPGLCGCGVADVDSDSDGTPDCSDGCPVDPNKVAPGLCGCGVADVDSDSDGTPDCNDGCPADPSKTAPGLCGCGVADTDSDSDGTPDCSDGCPDDWLKTEPGICGCGTPESEVEVWYPDADGDGYGSVASGGLVSCTPVEGWVLDNTDCDDGDPAINPSAAEVCDNAVDEDCSGDLADCHPELVGFVGEATIIASDLLRYGAIDVYAQFDPELVELVNVYDAVILHTAGAPFVQHDFGGGSWLPTLTDPATASIDSFVTIGGEPGAASGNTTTLDPEFGDGASETPPAGAGWYNANPGNLQGLADPSTGRVHLGRFVVQQTLMSGSLSFTGSVSFKAHPDGQARQATATVSIPYPALECPWDMDGDGLVDGGDIGLLLLQWGLESESADFDGDGTVGGEDLGVMLLHWGPCL